MPSPVAKFGPLTRLQVLQNKGSEMRCHLGFFPNSSGNKAAANLRPKMFMVNLKTFQPHAIRSNEIQKRQNTEPESAAIYQSTGENGI